MMELFWQNSFLFPPNNPIINVQLGLKYASRCLRISTRTIASVCSLKKCIYFTVCCSKTLINNILLIIMRFKSSRSQMFFQIGLLFLKISKYLEELAVLRVFLIACHAYNFIEKRLQHKYFLVNIAQFLRTSFFTELLLWLLWHLEIIKVNCETSVTQ